MKISPARKAAFEILLRIEKDKAFSSVLLPQYEDRLEPKDRGLCHELVLGVLRKLSLLDREIHFFTKGKKLDAEVRMALRLGLYQLRYLDRIPAYSAINESVELVLAAKKRSAKGFVNAILRRATREASDLNYTGEVEQVSTETNIPQWLIEKWTDNFGREKAFSLARSGNEPPKIAFRAVDRTSKEFADLIKDRHDLLRSEISPGGFIANNNDPELIQAARNGIIYIQDEASQLAANLAAKFVKGKLLDVCAAPGSKTTLIADILNEENVKIFAGDKYHSRLRRVKEAVRPHISGKIHLANYDAEHELPFGQATFDTVLVDAPCSGTGTIRHNPEIPLFLEHSSIKELSVKQLNILLNASKMVSLGGKLIYSTCSLEPEENEQVCKSFIESAEKFIQVHLYEPQALSTSRGYIRTFPDSHGCDGFFIAIFEKC